MGWLPCMGWPQPMEWALPMERPQSMGWPEILRWRVAAVLEVPARPGVVVAYRVAAAEGGRSPCGNRLLETSLHRIDGNSTGQAYRTVWYATVWSHRVQQKRVLASAPGLQERGSCPRSWGPAAHCFGGCFRHCRPPPPPLDARLRVAQGIVEATPERKDDVWTSEEEGEEDDEGGDARGGVTPQPLRSASAAVTVGSSAFAGSSSRHALASLLESIVGDVSVA